MTGSLRNSLQYNNFQPEVDSNPIADRVPRKPQRLPSNDPIETAPDPSTCASPHSCFEGSPPIGI